MDYWIAKPLEALTVRRWSSIIADVGQNAFEEVSIAQKGDNLGWNVWEGNECLEANCSQNDADGESFVFPVHTYPHSEGQSITGGMACLESIDTTVNICLVISMTGKVWLLTDWDTTPRVELLANLGFNISHVRSRFFRKTHMWLIWSGKVLYRFEFPQ